SITTYFSILDSFGYETRKRLNIIIELPQTTSTTAPTTTSESLGPLIPVVGVLSIVGVIVILLRSKR
ncbi:MAG: hypothetical protein ACFFE1_15045, partial [Candidatus Thorarchaeota archaeon]